MRASTPIIPRAAAMPPTVCHSAAVLMIESYLSQRSLRGDPMPTKWKGGPANRSWGRLGYVAPIVKGDQERGRRLWALLALERFWCDVCGSCHPLAEHRDCRAN